VLSGPGADSSGVDPGCGLAEVNGPDGDAAVAGQAGDRRRYSAVAGSTTSHDAF
jgi:hypothetical protein